MIDKASEFFATRKGLLPMIGIIFILLNLILQFMPGGWLRETNLFLHFGLLVAIIGLMLAWAL
jgi:hypothetical protein